MASDVFSRVVNKSPVRGTVRGAGLKSTDTYYSLLDFIERQCNALNGRFDRKMIDGELRLPSTMKLSVDVMEYQLNWTNKHDRRNTVFSTLCSVDQNTRYILGMHANYDKDIDSFKINKAAALNGDTLKPEAFREYAQYWLNGDELLGNRQLGQRLGFNKSRDILNQIADIYANAQSRDDIENRENQKLDPEYCNPILSEGCQIHIPYTCYAHFMLMQQMLSGASVATLFYYMDCDSMLRAGFMSAFQKEIAKQKAHGFYVRYTKYLSVPKKNSLYEDTKKALKRFKSSLPSHLRDKAQNLLMLEHIQDAAHIGKWKDKWVKHPIPSMNQPNKAICWLTEPTTINMNDEMLAAMFLDVGINAVDNIFQISRRLMNAFERPIGTSSG